MRKTVPGCVPAGTRSLPLPSSVGTSTSPPRAACTNVTGTVHTTSSPARRKNVCCLTVTVISRSPAGLSERGLLPAPVTTLVAPASTPAGSVTLSDSDDDTRPLARHVVHAWRTDLPVPLH